MEYYRITGIEKYKTAIINFADRILETDFTVIGCCGCTHELFDNSTVRQANTTNDRIQQETCVTVTLMKFLSQLTLLTGNPKYVDAFEISLYNAYLSSVNTENQLTPSFVTNYPQWKHEPMPFDSYNPLTSDVRGKYIGGWMYLSDNSYYGCCACIGAAGIGLVPKMQILTTKSGFSFNLFINGTTKTKTPSGNEIEFITRTNYPIDGKIEITIHIPKPEIFEILLRNPKWSKNTQISINDSLIDVSDGYNKIKQKWKNGDKIEINLDMRTEAVLPEPYGNRILMNKVVWGSNYVISTFDEEDPRAKNHIALRRGPIMLAQESRLGYSLDDAIEVKVDNGYVDVAISEKDIPYNCILKAEVPLSNGNYMTVTDYASAGKLWNEETKMAVWMLTTRSGGKQ